MQKFEGKCFNCNKIGHKSHDCLKTKGSKTNKTENVLTAIACSETLATKSGEWCLNSNEAYM